MVQSFRKKTHMITIDEAFAQFLLSKQAQGLSKYTIKAYRGMYDAASKYLYTDTPLAQVTRLDLQIAIGKMARTDLSRNTIRSYTATLKSFFSWCREEGLSDVNVPLYKGEDSVPETYTEEDLQKLLLHPKKRCSFPELRAWAIVNLLVNNGLRAASIRNIQNRDVMLDQNMILIRHTKKRRALAVPLSPTMVSVLTEYMRTRQGDPDDWLFPNQDDGQMAAGGLRSAIRRYNISRGVEMTSLHAFRHTFARMYLVDCGGDALKLQKLLGHSTLDMTKHYVKLFNTDLVKDFQEHSPLERLAGGQHKKTRRP